MSELPKGWTYASLSSLVEFNPKHSADTDDDLEVSFVPMAAVSDRTGTIEASETRAYHAVKKGYTHFQTGDVIFAKITPCMENGKSAVARDLKNGLACGSTEFFVMRSHGALLPDLLHRFIRQESFRAAARASMTGAVGQARVGKEFMEATVIPVPPLSEQRRIADKLDDLLARVDACRDRLDRVPAILKRFRQAVLAAATSGELTRDWRDTAAETDAWRTLSIGEIVDDVRYGTSKKCEHAPGKVPVLRIPNVAGGFISHDDLKHAEFDDSELRKLSLAPGDVLMIRSNGSVDLVGRSAVATAREAGFLYAGYLIRLRVLREIVRPGFLHLSISAPATRDIIELTARSTTGVNNINAEEIRSLPIAVPSLAEQDEILRRVGLLLDLADLLEARTRTGTDRVQALVPAILAMAFRGDLVPQDPSDEPASVLLDRIQAVRPSSGPALKKRGRSPKVPVGSTS